MYQQPETKQLFMADGYPPEYTASVSKTRNLLLKDGPMRQRVADAQLQIFDPHSAQTSGSEVTIVIILLLISISPCLECLHSTGS